MVQPMILPTIFDKEREREQHSLRQLLGGAQAARMIQEVQAGQMERQEQATLKDLLSRSGGDFTKASQEALRAGHPIVAAKLGKLAKDMKNEPSIGAVDPAKFDPASLAEYKRTGDPAVLRRVSEPKEYAPPEVIKITEALQALPPNDPRRPILEKRLDFLTTKGPQVEIKMPGGFGFQQVTGPDGKPQIVAVQVPSGGGEPKITPVGEPAPPESRRADKGVPLEAIESQIDDMITLIKTGEGKFTGVVGPKSIIGKAVETGRGLVDPMAPTPAIDFDAQKQLLIANLRKDIAGGGTFSNKDAERIEMALGAAERASTPGAAIRALQNIKEFVRNRRMTGTKKEAPKKPVTEMTNKELLEAIDGKN